MARNKHPEETVEKILDVTMRLFSEKGYEHTTIQDIVDALGMSKGAIYHHFKSKEDIIDRLNDRYYEGLDWFPDLSKIPGRTAWRSCATPSATFSPTRPSGRLTGWSSATW